MRRTPPDVMESGADGGREPRESHNCCCSRSLTLTMNAPPTESYSFQRKAPARALSLRLMLNSKDLSIYVVERKKERKKERRDNECDSVCRGRRRGPSEETAAAADGENLTRTEWRRGEGGARAVLLLLARRREALPKTIPSVGGRQAT